LPGLTTMAARYYGGGVRSDALPLLAVTAIVRRSSELSVVVSVRHAQALLHRRTPRRGGNVLGPGS
jgi:hypothetical protein